MRSLPRAIVPEATISMFSDILQSELQAASRNFRQPGDIRIDHDAAAYDRIAKSITYKPETSWNYELGAHLNLLDSRLQLDLSAFYMQIRDQQVSVMARTYGFGRMMTNAAKSHSCGLEARLRGITTDERLSWSLAYGFTSACFDDYTDSVRTATGYAPVSYKDNHVPFVPQHTLAATADYKILVDPAALLDPTHRLHLRDVTVGLNLAAQGQTYWDEANTISQNFYATLGAHAEGQFRPAEVEPPGAQPHRYQVQHLRGAEWRDGPDAFFRPAWQSLPARYRPEIPFLKRLSAAR